MVGMGSGELQTLISTLQSLNTQVGFIFQALSSRPLPAVAVDVKIAGQMGAVTTSAPLGAPEGYVTIDIPGVGPRLIAYWPVSNG
jgi:hypothetical protein